MKKLWLALGCAAVLCGCSTVDNANRADQGDLAKEGTIVFARPDDRSLFGTESISDYVEVTGERFFKNAAGQPMVEITLRNKGKDHWYNALSETPQIVLLQGKADFFEGNRGRTLYSTNAREIVLKLGVNTRVEFVCPVKTAGSYQIILNQAQKR